MHLEKQAMGRYGLVKLDNAEDSFPSPKRIANIFSS